LCSDTPKMLQSAADCTATEVIDARCSRQQIKLVAGPSRPLFLNRCGRPITRFGIHTVIERNALQARAQSPALATKRVSPHSIRHTTATHLLRAGVDINTIRGWLGHVSLETTNVYAEIDFETKAKALAKCEIADTSATRQHWRDQPALMDFLHAL